jgi:asparagine synthase (glutamine-hydrolysing)
MCGIAGAFAVDPRFVVPAAAVEAMAASLRHRGPDGEGFRHGPGYALAHRRLAIVDLATGQQPMTDGDGLWVTFNGEIYNHVELRRELQRGGARFSTNSDTEVLLHGYRAFGADLPRRLRGMFAFVVVDERARVAFAARDRIGKKPFLYALHDGALWFASEAKALLAAGVDARIDPDAIAQFLCLRYVPEPATAYRAIRKLLPGHHLTFDAAGLRTDAYWRPSFAQAGTRTTDRATAEANVLAAIDEAVAIRRMSEVPLGAFLSGGIDSQVVVESLARQSGEPVVACGIGFTEPRFDELPFIRTAAQRYGAVLHEATLAPADLADLGWFDATFDEPFADASAIPTFHVSRLARRHVTVALSGDGGDESFGGYRRYRFDRIENRVRGLLPGLCWRVLGSLYPKADWLPRALRFRRTLQNLGRSADLAYARSVSANLPEDVLPLWRGDPAIGDPLRAVRDAYRASDATDPLHRAAAADFATWLPADVLTKVDRASMAVGLEVRCPFLDHVVVETAATLPAAWHLDGGRTKAFLRRALRDRLDPATLTRKKAGFSVPLAAWIRGPLGGRVLEPDVRERLSPWLDVDGLGVRLDRHRRGLRDESELLWAAVVLDRFLARWAR